MLPAQGATKLAEVVMPTPSSFAILIRVVHPINALGGKSELIPEVSVHSPGVWQSLMGNRRGERRSVCRFRLPRLHG